MASNEPIDLLRADVKRLEAELGLAKSQMQSMILDATLPEHLRANAHRLMDSLLKVSKERDNLKRVGGALADATGTYMACVVVAGRQASQEDLGNAINAWRAASK